MSLLANSNAIESGGYPIQRSLRFRSSASAYLSRTPASTSNRKTFTWSGWMKRGADKYCLLFAAGNVTDIWNTGTNCTYIAYGVTTNALTVYNSGTVWRNTAQVFRDPSAWYHIIVAVDTTQATAANRVKMYVNGSEVTAWDTNNNPTQNLDTAINVNQNHFIAGQSTNVANAYFDGYLAEVNFIDGQALTPSSFGQTDPVTGVWQPLKYAGTYGTNGFYLPFSDNTSATTLAYDKSGNGNNWTANNISTTAGATYDSMTDVPTLTSATAANFAVLNPLANNTGSITNGNLNWIGSAGSWNISPSTIFASSGKYYFEATAASVGTTNNFSIGTIQSIATYGQLHGCYLGLDSSSWGFYWNGASSFKLNNNNLVTVPSGTIVAGDILQCAVDVDAGKIWFGRNNTWVEGSPSAGTGASYTNLTGSIGLGIAEFSNNENYSVNFGQQPFSYTPPTGFVALNTFNLPDPTIKKPNQYMDATTYTGTGSALSVTNAASFQPDFVWVKGRSGATDHALYDVVRGVQNQLESNTTTAETTETTGLTAFNSNGFSVGALAQMNTNAATYVGWQWKAGGTSSSNTDGSITSTVSKNTTSGFSIVTYTGTGANATVGHGLGVAPRMILLKQRNGSTYAWNSYHASLGNTYYIQLNTASAADNSVDLWNSTTPTTTVFSLSGSVMNNNGGTYVAYCFAPIAGYSAFGSYTGNGSTDGPFCYTGFQPKFVMIKRTDSVGEWDMFDTSRSPYNLANVFLQAQSSAAEATGSSVVEDILSNGFKIRGTDSSLNASGGTYIFAAFAANPFKYSLAR